MRSPRRADEANDLQQAANKSAGSFRLLRRYVSDVTGIRVPETFVKFAVTMFLALRSTNGCRDRIQRRKKRSSSTINAPPSKAQTLTTAAEIVTLQSRLAILFNSS